MTQPATTVRVAAVQMVSTTSLDRNLRDAEALIAQAARAGADEPLPVEAGKAQVSATVSGSVQMK